MALLRTALPALATLALLISAIAAQRKVVEEEPDKPRARDAQEPAQGKNPRPAAVTTLKVYEWGVATENWDGSPEPPEDVPSFYYRAEQIPIEAAPEKPVPAGQGQPNQQPDRPATKRKPVLYFECTQDIAFDLDIKFTCGVVTWLYPKANRRIDATTVQWDNIRLRSDLAERDKSPPPPQLPGVADNHWANYSREGSTSYVMVNGEAERFLFYEGSARYLPETDIFVRDGKVVVRNFTAEPLLDARVCVMLDSKLLRLHAASVPAAGGDTPGEATLDPAASLKSFGEAGTITRETQAAGLTEAQAKVFERCWHNEMFELEGTLSWRRTPRQLDELMQLKLTLPTGVNSEVNRVGYVQVRGIDLGKIADYDALVTKYLGGDADALKKLKGTAGAGALRRAMLDSNRPLKERVLLAKALAELAS
ncbi:MAG: hypothetical protein KF696_08245 [Planctomycetes bacterium]|nr:hypothetical protein [Planctomycetota bacterium]MCW8135659.1 hypothetical protein [Planctomycetota bacterium]